MISPYTNMFVTNMFVGSRTERPPLCGAISGAVGYMPVPPESIAIVSRMPPTIPTSGLSLSRSQSFNDPMSASFGFRSVDGRAYRQIETRDVTFVRIVDRTRGDQP